MNAKVTLEYGSQIYEYQGPCVEFDMVHTPWESAWMTIKCPYNYLTPPRAKPKKPLDMPDMGEFYD